MTGKELSDNLTFLSALKLLEQLVGRSLRASSRWVTSASSVVRSSRSLCQFARVSRRFLIGFGE